MDIKLKNNISDISHNYYKYLLNLPNVNGIGVGYKIINSFNTKEICLNVFVDKKIDIKYLSKNIIIPKEYMGIKTDVIKVGQPNFHSGEIFPGKFRPLEGGCSISVGDNQGEGTIGCIAVKKSFLFFNDYFILSNNHVLAGVNKIPIGTSILQPSEGLSGQFPEDIVANLTTFVPIKFIENNNDNINYVDCAIAKIKKNNLISKKILEIGQITGISKATLGSNVKKVGFITGLTEGNVIATNVTSKLPFENKFSIFQEQIRANLFNLSGDSGSIVLNDKNEAVGLLMGGPKDGSNVIFNDISLVLKYLNIDIFMP